MEFIILISILMIKFLVFIVILIKLLILFFNNSLVIMDVIFLGV